MLFPPRRPRCEAMIRLAKTMTFERRRQEARAAQDGLNPFVCRQLAYFVMGGHYLCHRHANRFARDEAALARLRIVGAQDVGSGGVGGSDRAPPSGGKGGM